MSDIETSPLLNDDQQIESAAVIGNFSSQIQNAIQISVDTKNSLDNIFSNYIDNLNKITESLQNNITVKNTQATVYSDISTSAISNTDSPPANSFAEQNSQTSQGQDAVVDAINKMSSIFQ